MGIIEIIVFTIAGTILTNKLAKRKNSTKKIVQVEDSAVSPNYIKLDRKTFNERFGDLVVVFLEISVNNNIASGIVVDVLVEKDNNVLTFVSSRFNGIDSEFVATFTVKGDEIDKYQDYLDGNPCYIRDLPFTLLKFNTGRLANRNYYIESNETKISISNNNVKTKNVTTYWDNFSKKKFDGKPIIYYNSITEGTLQQNIIIPYLFSKEEIRLIAKGKGILPEYLAFSNITLGITNDTKFFLNVWNSKENSYLRIDMDINTDYNSLISNIKVMYYNSIFKK